jgi:hypothetical protein
MSEAFWRLRPKSGVVEIAKMAAVVLEGPRLALRTNFVI